VADENGAADTGSVEDGGKNPQRLVVQVAKRPRQGDGPSWRKTSVGAASGGGPSQRLSRRTPSITSSSMLLPFLSQCR
jgi:hypothetical protein